jgi:hypothetical protein
MGPDILWVEYINKFELLKSKIFGPLLTVKEILLVAFMRYWKKRKCLEEDNFNNVPK